MTRLRALTAFTAVVLRTFLRDRTALFFILVLPVVVILIIGITFGGAGRLEIGVADESEGFGADVVVALEGADGLDVERFASAADLRDAVLRRQVTAGVVVPATFDDDVRAGTPTEVVFLAGPEPDAALTAQLTVGAVLDDVGTRLGAAAFAAEVTGRDVDEALPVAAAAAAEGGVAVVREDVGGGDVEDLSAFSLVAPQNLVLFVFINALASGAFLVAVRRDGLLRRALATPTSAGVLLAGMALGWFVFALVQSVLIVAIGRLVFDVGWGDPVAAVLLVVLWALVGSGAGVLVGAIGQDVDRVGAIGPPIGIVLGALGGCMVPLEVFPDAMRTVAYAIPHSWAVTAWQTLVFDGGGPGDIVGPLLVLAAWAVGLLTLAAVRMRRTLTA